MARHHEILWCLSMRFAGTLVVCLNLMVPMLALTLLQAMASSACPFESAAHSVYLAQRGSLLAERSDVCVRKMKLANHLSF